VDRQVVVLAPDEEPREDVPVQRIPVAYWEMTRSTNAPENARDKALILSLASAAPVAAACIERIVMAVAEGVGNTSLSSRAT